MHEHDSTQRRLRVLANLKLRARGLLADPATETRALDVLKLLEQTQLLLNDRAVIGNIRHLRRVDDALSQGEADLVAIKRDFGL